jgi:hypothetical protein
MYSPLLRIHIPPIAKHPFIPPTFRTRLSFAARGRTAQPEGKQQWGRQPLGGQPTCMALHHPSAVRVNSTTGCVEPTHRADFTRVPATNIIRPYYVHQQTALACFWGNQELCRPSSNSPIHMYCNPPISPVWCVRLSMENCITLLRTYNALAVPLNA